MGISTRRIDGPPSPGSKIPALDFPIVNPTVIQSFTSPHVARSVSPNLAMSTPVRDEQFTLVKGFADKLNIFSWMDAPNQKVEVAPSRVFNDFCKSRYRSNFPPYPNS